MNFFVKKITTFGVPLIVLAFIGGGFYFLTKDENGHSDEVSTFMGKKTTETPSETPVLVTQVDSSSPAKVGSFKEVDIKKEESYVSSLFSIFWKNKEKDSPKEVKDVRDDRSLESITVAKREWDQLQDDKMSCLAREKLNKEELNSVKENSFNLGKVSCLDGQFKSKEDALSALGNETEKIMDELRNKLRQYTKTNALINGRCEAEMKTGEWRWFELKDVCMSVVNKKVGNDGEITGVIGAVSKESQALGILRINCDVGSAHIDLLNNCR